jgi:Protein of unknown function (DUF4019)
MRRLAMVVVTMALTLGLPAWAADKEEVVATKNAEAWMVLVDQQKYGESWDAAAKLFQDTVARDVWTDALGAARGPLGKLVSRRVKSAESRTSLPGAPDGKYVIIQFDTSFEHKKSVVETITPMQEADGSWKVSGYFLK